MIIGVCGFAGSGKDTFADHLVAHHGFNKVSFAFPLKEAARIAFDFSDEQLYGPSSFREEEDTRYLFSGTCPHCQQGCRRWHKDAMPEWAIWWCEACDVHYREFVTPRLALQTLGTEWGRTLYPNIWVDACLSHIRRRVDIGEEDWVIPDCRFLNEVVGIKDAGGVVARLLRGEQRFSHASEAELANISLSIFDKVLDNTGTLPEFYTMIDEALPQLRHTVNA